MGMQPSRVRVLSKCVLGKSFNETARDFSAGKSEVSLRIAFSSTLKPPRNATLRSWTPSFGTTFRATRRSFNALAHCATSAWYHKKLRWFISEETIDWAEEYFLQSPHCFENIDSKDHVSYLLTTRHVFHILQSQILYQYLKNLSVLKHHSSPLSQTKIIYLHFI